MRIICIVGSDGSGKTTLAKHLVAQLQNKGLKVALIWMRYNNFLSKPLLALARLRGYNYFTMSSGVKMGHHDFSKVWWLRWPFAFLQMIDVNLAAWRKLRVYKGFDVLVFERSPWDTLSDVMVDTGIDRLEERWIGRGIVSAFAGKCDVVWIRRDVAAIRQTRRELAADEKLWTKVVNYDRMSRYFGWKVVDNNGTIEDAKTALCRVVEVNE